MNEEVVIEIQWEMVTDECGEITDRLKVDGGHLYHRTSWEEGKVVGTTMSFVPDVDLQRYQSHLRDAYTQGYEAGQIDARLGVNQP